MSAGDPTTVGPVEVPHNLRHFKRHFVRHLQPLPRPPVHKLNQPSRSRQTLASFDLDPASATVPKTMTAKEKLRERVETLTEQEAAETLRLLDHRTDPVIAAFHDAPEDDEPWTDEDEAAAAEGRADVAAGRTVSLDEAMRELG